MTSLFKRTLALLLLWPSPLWSVAAPAGQTPDYAAVNEIFTKHCLDCHGSQEPEANLVLESFPELMKGGESGPVVLPHRGSESLLVKMIEGTVERQGKRKIMPPGKRAKLSAEEIAAIKAWIDAGALPPAAVAAKALVVPKITPVVPPRRPIYSLAYSTNAHLAAVGRFQEIELLSLPSRTVVQVLKGHSGAVNALVFSSDGKFLFAAGGQPAVSGEVRQWDVAKDALVRTFHGHKDAVYALALSPDGLTLATGSYDQKIKLWDVPTARELKTLSGHNGAIFGLAFRPDGRILASASADRTVKLWDPGTGERRDTLGQSSKELLTLAFSPDGKRLFAAGADNRIRTWEISENAAETTNPLIESRFAHDAPILRLAFSADGKWIASSASDGTIKIWHAADLKGHLLLERQPDWPSALAFTPEQDVLMVGRLDGSMQFYATTDGHVLAPPKPQLVGSEPRGVQRGITAKLRLIGTNLVDLQEALSSDPRLQLSLNSRESGDGTEAWVTLTTPAELPAGAYAVWVRNAQGESGKVQVHVDDLPQVYVQRGGERVSVQRLDHLPVSAWATHDQIGQAEEFIFEGESGQSLVFDIAARRLGSKADVVITLSDADGKVLASSKKFDQSGDPLLFHKFDAAGTYRLWVSELVLAGSAEHFYRLSVGAFPYVTACFPLTVPNGCETHVQLIGYNLAEDSEVIVKPQKLGALALPVKADRFRSRRELKVLVTDRPAYLETEPNDTPAQATDLALPCAAGGRIGRPGDLDLFRFEAKAGQRWVIETIAAQRHSPVDTKVEVLKPDGTPVQRLQLQAVRDSAVTFRAIDSDTPDCRVVNWEEMELNQYLYLQGEIVKLFRAPQGPDSGFLFYTSGNGKRRCYFDTSPAAHAVDEPCYIVEPHPAGSSSSSGDLPAFALLYANDDDAERKLGTDSRLHFTAPADGVYLVRVSDSRSFGGEAFVYTLVIRPAEPDFKASVKAPNLTINAGSGQSFSVQAERSDGFEGEIRIDIGHLPRGFIASTPLMIQAGHDETKGVLYAAPEAAAPPEHEWSSVEVTASANVDGQAVVRALNNFGAVKLAGKPNVFVVLEPDVSQTATAAPAIASAALSDGGKPVELTIAPGERIPAVLRVQRSGYDDLITFTVENLPHGVIVDNIGLNGVLIPKGQNQRQIFLTAAKWVPETDRLCYAVENQAGRQTSRPVLLHVRHHQGLQAAAR